jgi:pimeloyl-ACP methyl ester carboxylesterase
MRGLIFSAALLCGLPIFAAQPCDVQVPMHTADVGEVRLAYQSIGRPRDPALLAILAEPSRVELLGRLCVPTLVVHGTADPLLPAMHGVHVAAHIKGSELKLIPGLAHRFQEAFKEPLLAAVLPHLLAHRGEGVWARL